MIYKLPLPNNVTFSYQVQYNGNGYMNIQIETLKKEWFKGPTNQSVAGSFIFPKVYAQRVWQKRIRAYPDDGCRKEYWLFSPGEEKIVIEQSLLKKQEKYRQHFEKHRADLEQKVADPTTEDPLRKTL